MFDRVARPLAGELSVGGGVGIFEEEGTDVETEVCFAFDFDLPVSFRVGMLCVRGSEPENRSVLALLSLLPALAHRLRPQP
jgi:hypothetical protein